ncbi:MAG: hypothetical protein AAF799_21010 [Myxococcota bacterium]
MGRFRGLLVVMALAAAGCTEKSDGASPKPDAPTPAVEPPAETADPPSPDAFPKDWVWVTDTRLRVEVAMPSLPRSASSAPGPSGQPQQRALVAERNGASFNVTAIFEPPPDSLADLVQGLERDGEVLRNEAWRGDGLRLSVRMPVGIVEIGALLREQTLYLVEVSGEPPKVDTQRFMKSLAVRAKPRAEPLRDGGLTVQAPARMGAWLDTSGIPPLEGHRGVLDGHQFGVHSTNLVLVSDHEQSLDGSVTEMRRSIGAELVELDPRPFGGCPSRRVELRARDGMYATIRLVHEGNTLVQAAVYAPSGREAPWADGFVDSLRFP